MELLRQYNLAPAVSLYYGHLERERLDPIPVSSGLETSWELVQELVLGLLHELSFWADGHKILIFWMNQRF